MKTKIGTEYDGKPRNLFAKICVTCANEFWVPRHVYDSKRFCSRDCIVFPDSRIDVLCNRCGKTFLGRARRPLRTGLRFCSRQCKDFSQRLDGIKALHPAAYGNGQSSYRQRALRDLGPRCVKCGYDEDIRMLDVDHIDSDRSNNRIDNLQVLCVWDHALKTRGVVV